MKRTDFSRRYVHRKSAKQPFLRILVHERGLKSGSEKNPTRLTGRTRGKTLGTYFYSNLGSTLVGKEAILPEASLGQAVGGGQPDHGGLPCGVAARGRQGSGRAGFNEELNV
jgi:hypothetical protein